jgi:DNA processing protein
MFSEFPILKLEKKDFPPSLLEIPQVPKELYIRGALPPQEFKKLCIVGTRKCSPYGRDVCEKLVKGLQGYPISIVSGLAIGTDTIAHDMALKYGLHTISVPGSGLGENVLYPRSNITLAKRILENGGCMLSEFQENFRAAIYSFPQRNRIMAGISDAVLIIEAEAKSGTLITARLATEYNKDVLTVPGSIFSNNFEGPLLLLKLGATPVASSDDILDALGIEHTKEFKTKNLFIELSDDEKTLVETIASPKTRDEILESIGWQASKLGQIMTLLEIKGVIKESGGKVYIT